MTTGRWRLGLGLAGLAAMLFVIAVRFGGIGAQTSGGAYNIGSGQQIRIEKSPKSYRNWDTGSTSDYAEYVLSFKGAKIGPAELKKWLAADDSGGSDLPAILEAVELQPDDFLLLLGTSQSTSYDVMRIHLDAGTAALKADVVELGGEKSQYNWFPDSRLPGWLRVVTTGGAQFMIRQSPFQVVPLGQGQLAKVVFPFAFIVGKDRKASQVGFRAVDLNAGKTAAALTLDGDCFSLPAFSFDHPKLDAHDTTEDNGQVGYNYGPKWWDKNIDWNPQAITLRLRPDHLLAAPAAKVWSIRYAPTTPVTARPATPTNEPMAESPPDWDADEIDQVPAPAKNCTQKNPKGAEKAKSLPASEEQVDAAAFCLHEDWPVDPAIKHQVCGAPVRKTLFSGEGVAVNEVTVAYHPVSRTVAPVQVVVPEIELKGKRYIGIEDPASKETHGLKELFVLNESQVLFKARSSGPWVLYLLSATQEHVGVTNIGWYGYPGGPFASIGDDNFLYDTRSGTLVRKKPFGYRDHEINLADIQGMNAVTVYEQDGKVGIQITQFGLDPDMEEKTGSPLELPVSCFGNGKDDLLFQEMSMTARQAWFNKYFVWSGDRVKLSLKAPCQRHR